MSKLLGRLNKKLKALGHNIELEGPVHRSYAGKWQKTDGGCWMWSCKIKDSSITAGSSDRLSDIVKAAKLDVSMDKTCGLNIDVDHRKD